MRNKLLSIAVPIAGSLMVFISLTAVLTATV